MNSTLREDADAIIRASLNAVLPDEAVRRALEAFRPGKGRVLLVAVGKAAWQMAHTAVEVLGAGEIQKVYPPAMKRVFL